MRIVLLALLLGACGDARDPGGASPSEARQLNESAAMLDANSMAANEVDSDGADQ